MACGGCCCDSTPISWVSYFVTWAALICGLIAISTPNWTEQNGTNTNNTDFAGIFIQCKGFFSDCEPLTKVLDDFKDTYKDNYEEFLANLSLQLTGLVALIVAVVLFSVYSCCLSNKYLAYVIIVLLLLATGCIISGASVYGIKLQDAYKDATTLSWSYGLDVACGGLSLVAGILLIINSCCL